MWSLFIKYQRIWEVSYWICLAIINASVATLSRLDDFKRLTIAIEPWQIYSWEFTSAVAILLLVPIIIIFDKYNSLNSTKYRRHLINHLLFSAVFSLLHIGFMVVFRKIIYWFYQSSYDFGDWPSEMLYEYRKDVMTYIGILSTIYVYRFILSRLRGEAVVIGENEDSTSEQPSRLLVKKLGKEFIVNISSIEWVEAAGNYMNLHVNNQCYPIRKTMRALSNELIAYDFVRIHRSTIVNINCIDHIETQESGDGTVTLNNGKKLNYSRRYRDNLTKQLQS